MARLDVYANPDRESAEVVPYVLDVQADLLSSLPTVAVIPLAQLGVIDRLPILRLNPQFQIGRHSVVALTQDIASIPRRLLKKPVTNLSQQRDEILAALDLLFTGL